MFVDIGIAVIILICFIVGIVRGSLKTFLSICVIVGGVLLSAWLTGLLVSWVKDAFPDVYTKFLEFCVGNKPISLLKIYEGCVEGYADSKTLEAIYAPIYNVFLQGNMDVAINGATVSDIFTIMPVLLSLHTGMLIILFVVYLAVTIVLEIVAHIIKAIVKGRHERKPNGFSRFIGALMGVVNGALISAIILLVGSAVIPVPALTQPMTSQTDESMFYTNTMSYINETCEPKIINADIVKDALEIAGYTVTINE